MIIRPDKRKKAQQEPQTNTDVLEGDLDDVLVADLKEPATQPVKRGPGRPKGSTKEKALPVLYKLPEGMTDEIMAWACDVDPAGNMVYRWRTGIYTMPEVGHLVMALWTVLGEDEFLRVLTRIRGTEAPGKKPRTFESLIVESFGDDLNVQSLGEIHEYITLTYGREIGRRALGAILSRMKSEGKLASDARDQWRLVRN